MGKKKRQAKTEDLDTCYVMIGRDVNLKLSVRLLYTTYKTHDFDDLAAAFSDIEPGGEFICGSMLNGQDAESAEMIKKFLKVALAPDDVVGPVILAFLKHAVYAALNIGFDTSRRGLSLTNVFSDVSEDPQNVTAVSSQRTIACLGDGDKDDDECEHDHEHGVRIGGGFGSDDGHGGESVN
jgi:hypothetical protein